jgi:DNA polymerase-3 subunit epsilon
MAQMNIRCAVRHQAAADTLATAELLQKLWPAAQRDMGGKVTFAAASHLAAQRRWLT